MEDVQTFAVILRTVAVIRNTFTSGFNVSYRTRVLMPDVAVLRHSVTPAQMGWLLSSGSQEVPPSTAGSTFHYPPSHLPALPFRETSG